ncbi:Pentacotripeptide-repeat region of PRORP [Dillenia turbinata]|uniref:Pentacotripeptide-repeat region of PRORP n=1 Tax=Dillenia turbinata TaxID=194707 RepID=A0AAN8ZAB4_9MAGN
MSRLKCYPTYNTLVDGLYRAGKVSIAQNMLKDIPRALNVFEEMVMKGLKPNRVTYSTIIQVLFKVQNLEKIREILEGAAGREELVPDTCTFNTLISAHCNAANIDESLEVFEKMSPVKLQPDSAAYSPLIGSLCQQGNFKRAEELFDELSEKDVLLRGHCKEGTYEPGFDLLVLMLRRVYVPDFEAYQSLIEGLLQKGDPVLAHKILEKMLKSSHIHKASDFDVLLQELLKKDRAQEAASFLVMMLGLREEAFEVVGLIMKTDIQLTWKNICFLRKKFQDAQKILLSSLDKDHEVDVEICGNILNGLCRSHRVSEAFELYHALVEKLK